ncbi:Basic helix-loop-helix transcription factor [Abeliophyllum distichum]|uniref:Basic helix-loop-helix transcription factor n=1 Tax=Abeliophyllum distichum TaxID=126358 RepID=A0ABD1TLS5_9LAMI
MLFRTLIVAHDAVADKQQCRDEVTQDGKKTRPPPEPAAINLDEISDLEPILAEIFSSDHLSQCNSIDALNSQQASIKIEAKQLSSYINGSQLLQDSSKLISFGNSNQTDKLHMISRNSTLSPQIINFSSLSKETAAKSQYDAANERDCSMIRNPLQAQEHVVAERKRREKLNQFFIAVSKVLPGLKKATIFFQENFT